MQPYRVPYEWISNKTTCLYASEGLYVFETVAERPQVFVVLLMSCDCGDVETQGTDTDASLWQPSSN
ncbi:unnamed protein product [Lota lota]